MAQTKHSRRVRRFACASLKASSTLLEKMRWAVYLSEPELVDEIDSLRRQLDGFRSRFFAATEGARAQ